MNVMANFASCRFGLFLNVLLSSCHVVERQHCPAVAYGVFLMSYVDCISHGVQFVGEHWAAHRPPRD
jgi:hypothetical protein